MVTFYFVTTALENQLHYEAYQLALKEEVAIPLKYLKVLFFGPPRTGKTSMRRRLVGEIQNLANESVQASTGTAERYDVIVKLVDDKTTTSTSVITKSEWLGVKTSFRKEKSHCVTDLDDELRLLYQFTYRAAPAVKKPLVLNPVIEEDTEEEAKKAVAQDDDTKEQSPAIKKTDDVSGPTELPKTIDEIDPNNKKDSSIGKRQYDLSAKQKDEIEMAFEAFKKILHTPGQEQLKALLDGTILMNMVDTGGQPAFLEMLPALTIGPALYLIFFRLNQELKERYQIKYVSKNNEEVQLGDSSYTVEEVIFQALSSIACFGCTVPKKANMPNPSHAAVLMGTHKDWLGSDPEDKIKAKDDALQKRLKEILKIDLAKSDKHFLRYASDDQLMFAIDNMTGDEQELTKVRERLADVIKQMFNDNEVPIPASWLMFSIFLRKMGKRTLNLLQCHKIGERLEVRDTDEALWFLHHCVGILMHFPNIQGIKDLVICDPQVVFDSVTNLILNSFNLKQVSKLACDKFKETGQFNFRDIQSIASNSESDSLPLPELIKLLEHLNIIAPIEPEGRSSQSNVHQKIYFMPAVLKHAKEEELQMKQSITDPVPLMICFRCGFVPVGVFCAIIAHLVAEGDSLGWILQEPPDKPLCKNKVSFKICGAFDVTLISKPKRYEIYIERISDIDIIELEHLCKFVLQTFCDALDQVISKMKYKQCSVIFSSDQASYELGFKCPKHSNDDHLVINRPCPIRGQKSPSAKVLWSDYLEKKSLMICLEEEKATRLELFQSFAQQSLVWFGKVSQS